jgi:dienelactone hydrolase
MKAKPIIFLILSSLLVSCNGQEAKIDSYQIKRLEKAENSRSVEAIKALFDANAILYTTELMPVKGKKAIVSVYEFIFSQGNVENVRYGVDSTNTFEERHYEYGRLSTQRVGQNDMVQAFKVVFERRNDEYKIVEISFGEEDQLKKELPKMLAPSGDFQVGQRTYFFNKKESGNGRLLSFQVWYPTNSKSPQKLPFRTEAVISNASDFLGFPSFATSYFSEIESHTILNAPSIPEKKFPVLIYNHGYGGFTQVYQTVFEDLVSHGYIVVSIGHENESALLIKENGEVIPNSPDNEFYAKRSPELNGAEIGRWQSLILNSNKIDENTKAYREMLKLTPLHNESTRLWASDTKAAIEKLRTLNHEGKNLSGIFDLNKMGIFGHSLGGATAGQLCFGNTSLKAGINLDGFQFGDLFHNKLEVPFMFVSSNQEGDRYLRASTFIKNSSQDCYQISIKGFAHDNFTDLKYILEGDKEAMELQRSLVKSFFDIYLKAKVESLKELEKEYERIELKDFP